MKRFCKLIPIFILILATVLLAVACNPTDAGPELRNVAGADGEGYYTLLIGEESVSLIRFEVWDDGVLQEGDLRATPEMFSHEDMAKFQTVGQHTVTLHYEGLSLVIKIRVVEAAPADEYTATFHAAPGVFANGASDISVITTDKKLVSFPDVPTREGYTFYGWYDNAAFEGNRLVSAQGARVQLHADTDYYARWRDERTFSVTFHNAQTGAIIQVNGQNSMTDIEYGSYVTPPADPYVEGYRFVGWYLRVEYTGTNGEMQYRYETWDYQNTPVTSELHVYAVFEEQFYFVTFRDDDGSILHQYRVREGGSFGTASSEQQVFPPVPARSGYSVMWFDEDRGRAPDASYSDIRRDINIVAQYTPLTYTYTFHYFNPLDDNDGLDALPNGTPANRVFTVRYGDLFPTPPQTETVTGYIGSWYYLYNGRYVSAAEVLTRRVTESMDFYAHYERRTYTVRFENGGTEIGRFTKKYNEEITQSEVPTVAYDTRLQSLTWYTNSQFVASTRVSFPYVVRPSTDTVTFYLRIVELPRTVDFVLPATTTDDDPAYNNLQLSQSFLTSEDNGFTLLANGQYLILSYVLDVENEPDRRSVAVPILNDPQYEIVGWLVGGAPVDLEDGLYFFVDDIYSALDPDGKGPVVAVVRVRTYNVTFYQLSADFTGYEPYATTQQRFGSAIEEPDESQLVAPIYPGEQESRFEFGGWYADPSLQGMRVNFTNQIVTGNMYYYPRWYDPTGGTDGLNYVYHEVEGQDIGYYEVVSYRGIDTAILVPRTWSAEGYPTARVTHIAKGAFYNSELVGSARVTEVTIFPNYVTDIAEGAFDNLTLLVRIVFRMEETNESNDGPFRLVNGMLYRVNDAGDYELIVSPAQNEVLNNTSTAWNVTLPTNLIRIGENAFMDNTNLISLSVGGNQSITIGDGAFAGASALTAVSLGAPVVIGEYAFKGCIALATINFSADNLQYVYTNAFFDTRWYETAEDSATDSIVLNTVLLRYVGDLTTYRVPDAVTVIATGAFEFDASYRHLSGNYDLLSTVRFTINSQLRRIATAAFAGCYKVESIEILCGDNAVDVVDIEMGAFDGLQVGARLVTNTQMQSAYRGVAAVADYFGERVYSTTVVD